MKRLPKTKNIKVLEFDWHDKPGKKPFSRINRMMANTDTRELQKIQKMKIVPKEIPLSNHSEIYGLDGEHKWKLIGYQCLDCGKVMNKTSTLEKHPLICTKEIKINKEIREQEMPIQRIEKDGEIYYRWGVQGKLYKNRADAEKQAKAIYSEPTVNKGRPQVSPKVTKK